MNIDELLERAYEIAEDDFAGDRRAEACALVDAAIDLIEASPDDTAWERSYISIAMTVRPHVSNVISFMLLSAFEVTPDERAWQGEAPSTVELRDRVRIWRNYARTNRLASVKLR